MLPSLLVLDKNFIATYAISEFTSLIWTERYYKPGDFELETLFIREVFDNIKVGNYIYLDGSNRLMVVESVQITYNAADKTEQILLFKGRTMDSMLDRRIIWGAWSISGNIVTALSSLIRQNVTSPSDPDRKISVLHLGATSASGYTTIAASGYADNLLDVTNAACEAAGIGLEATYVDETDYCTLHFYKGKDRSYDQSSLPPVIFSASYENLGNTRYSLDTTEYKTLAYAYGPEEELEIKDEEGNVTNVIKDRTIMIVGARKLVGLDRREMGVSASSSKPEEVQQTAMEKLASLNQFDVMDTELDPNRQFVYGKDFFMGDIVQVVTEFGLDTKARVTEFIRSWSSTGYTEVPTFEVLNPEDYTSQAMV